jgi:hypothetical protein
VASYAARVRRGRVAIYRVLAPERCTLSLARHRGVWAIDQLERACNRPPSASTVAAVTEWLEQGGVT